MKNTITLIATTTNRSIAVKLFPKLLRLKLSLGNLRPVVVLWGRTV